MNGRMINVFAASDNNNGEIPIVSEESEVFQTEESNGTADSGTEKNSEESSEETTGENSEEEAVTGEEAEEISEEEVSENETSEETGEILTETEAGGTSFWGSQTMYTTIGGSVAGIIVVAVILYLVSKNRKKKKEEERRRRREKEIIRKPREEDPYPDEYIPENPVRKIIPENRNLQSPVVEIGKVHGIGKREEQQDSMGVSQTGTILQPAGKGVFAVVADGMGGLANGAEVSGCVVMSMLQCFDSVAGRYVDGVQELLTMLNYANSEVNSLLRKYPGQRCGSTVVSVIIRNDEMFWLSVGDSHIYLYRNGSLLLLNREHVYAVELDEKAARGEISIEDALSNPKRKALTSFVGIGKIEQIDRNAFPVKLQTGDRILMMSDGVFGSLSDEEIVSAMAYPVGDSARVIDQMIAKKNYSKQDNYTALIMEYKGNW